jgi:hypothetical protein
MREACQGLSSEKDYRLMYDPFWVRAEPYRLAVPASGGAEFHLHVRNFLQTAQRHRIAVHTPPGLSAHPPVLEGRLRSASRQSLPVRLRAEPGMPPGVYLVAFDVTLDDRRYGQRFDMMVEVRPAATAAPAKGP